MRDMFNINSLPRSEVLSVKWRTKSGETIAVGDMDLEHLTNTYKFCERQAQAAEWWMDVFATEAKRRGFRVQTKRSWFKRRVKR